MNQNSLTIAIPTYNRPNQLRSTLLRLIPQLTHECVILIIDNHSPIPAESILDEIVYEHKDQRIKVVRNKINIGGNANVCRCFELCETKYLWILGDDDSPMPDAIKTVLNNIEENPNVSFFNYCCELFKRKETRLAEGLIDFIQKIDNFGNLLFASNNIYKMDLISNNIQFAYQYTFTLASQIAILLQSLEKSSKTIFSSKQIVSICDTAPEDRWSIVQQSLGYISLAELPKIVSNGLSESWLKMLNLDRVPVLLLFREVLYLTENKNYNYSTKKFMLDQIFFRRFYKYPKYLRLLRIPLRLLLRFPKMIMFIFKTKKRIMNKVTYKHHFDTYFR